MASPAASPLTWKGTASGTGAANGEGTCTEGVSCDSYTLTVGGTPADWAAADKRIEVTIAPPSAQDDYDLVIRKTDKSGAIVDRSGAGAGVTEVAHISPATDGVGTFFVHVIYFATTPPDQYDGKATVVPRTPPPAPAAPQDSGPKVGYENFEAPGVFTTTVQGNGNTTEYLGRGAGEPSIGVNWNSAAPNNAAGVTNFQSDLQTLFVTFDDSCPAGGKKATWFNRPAPTSQAVDSDPIGFTDPKSGRVFAAELTATSPGCKISYSDNDGVTWVPTTGPAGSAIDHQSIGGGPYHLISNMSPPYAAGFNALYYCSQDLATAYCLRSDDGGVSYKTLPPMYTTECGGLHGHVKVSPKEGTVYVPNKNCGGSGAVTVSEDNGVTWKVRNVQNAISTTAVSAGDPAIGIDKNGRVYFAIANNDNSLVVATSDNQGSSWQNIFDVSSAYGIKNVRYPAAVGGDKNRAAVAFLGSATAGNTNGHGFVGSWHLYVAHTFDGGASWTVSDATPDAPMQRGCIWTGGGADICRNTLDFFDVAIDKQGRVQVGYANGCPGGNCVQAAEGVTGNAYSATATIARQSSGRRLVAASDPASATSVPGIPSVTVRRIGAIAHVGWSEGDTGNSPLAGFQILRGTKANEELFLAQVGPEVRRYDDVTATDPTQTYYYKVLAMNATGTSCGNNETAAPYVGDSCPGISLHQNDAMHLESASVQNGANAQLAIDYISVAEPLDTTKPGGNPNLVFRMKVANLSSIPPNSRWRMVWDTYASAGQQYYVGMTSDASSVVTYEYGEIATAVVGLVIGVPTETRKGSPTGSMSANGLITITVPRSAVGNPPEGSLLGAVGGRTFTGDTAQTKTLERSTALIDHTFVKGQTDSSFPAATYTMRDSAHMLNNHAPVATIVADKVYGNPTLTVTFTATGSDTADGDVMGSFRYHFGDAAADVTKFCGAFPTVNTTCGGTSHDYTAPGYYTATVVAIDSCGLESAPVSIQIHVNAPPVANAGADFNVNETQTAMLSGSASSDVDNDVLSYAWIQTAGPAVTLSNASSATPSFVAPSVAADTTLTFQLTVTDQPGNLSSTDTVNVTVVNINLPPLADAGPDQHVDEGTLVTLSGTGSDPDGTSVTYSWAQTSGPTVTLNGPASTTPRFKAPNVSGDTTLAFRLTVTDALGASATDDVEISVHDLDKIGDNKVGALPPLTLMLLGLLGLRRRR